MAGENNLIRKVILAVSALVHCTDRAVNTIPAFSFRISCPFLLNLSPLNPFSSWLKCRFFCEVYILFPRAPRCVMCSLTVLYSLSCSIRVLQWNLALCKSRHRRRHYLRGRRSSCSVRPGAPCRLLASYGCWMASRSWTPPHRYASLPSHFSH